MHGDDYVAVGPESALKLFSREMKKRYERKTELLGLDSDDARHVKVLGWIMGIQKNKGQVMVIYEAALRHAEVIVKELGARSRERSNITYR